jgi:hypothetical protein
MSTTAENSKIGAARAWFVGACLLVGGWAGVVVGALAMAVENAVTKGRESHTRTSHPDSGEATTSEERAARREAWLRWDANDRAQRRAAVRDWYRGDQNDPKPTNPNPLSRFARRIRRALTQLRQLLHHAKAGWDEGWDGSNTARKQGKGPGEIIRDRKTGSTPPPADGTRTPEPKPRPVPRPASEPIPKPEPIPASEPTPEAPTIPALPVPQIPMPEAPLRPQRKPRGTSPAAPTVNLNDQLGDLARQIEEIRNNLGGTK